ncbi:hypothetical protein Csa_014880, partial [Cucumis sativus]
VGYWKGENKDASSGNLGMLLIEWFTFIGLKKFEASPPPSSKFLKNSDHADY